MIVIKKQLDGEFYFCVKAKNGKVLCHSEGYKRKAGVLKAIKALKSLLPVKDLS